MKTRVTKKELLKKIKVMQLLGDDLVAAIENACWRGFDDRPNLHGPTYHMRTAVNMWKEKDHV